MRKRRIVLIGLGLCLAALLAPIAWIEISCMEKRNPQDSSYQPILAPEHRRPETNTYVTYPEWLIVHVYEDYAAVSKTKGESAFPYFGSIARYWCNLCVMTQQASARGEITGDSKAMLYTIGVSFSAEMAIKGAYEHTLGWLTEAIAGNEATPEDRFARDMADDYAVFLVQTPWYAYPFGQKLKGFWTEVPWQGGNWVRKIERRVAFSLEFGVKTLYSKAIGALAGIEPAPLRIRSVVRGGDLTGPGEIQRVETLADGTQIIETPRYRQFTHVVRRLAREGADFVEIAGNDEVFITALLPPGTPKLEESLIVATVAARPGWHRQGWLVKVTELAKRSRQLEALGGELEHVYEY